VVPFNGAPEIDRCIRRLTELKPDVVGLGIAFQYAIADYTDIAIRLRREGFSGHITCGGHVPTFCHTELLTDCSAMDSAVRHEGEQTFTALLDTVAAGAPVRDIPGLVWRENGAPVAAPSRPLIRDLDVLPFPKRRDKPLHVGSVRSAAIITSRGCVGDCAYCCIHAYGKDMGGPCFRMRDPEAVAAEIAGLRLEQGVRVFLVQDDLFILPSKVKTLERIAAIGGALERRGATDVKLWVKGRPETIDGDVVEAVRSIGAIHLFIGVENAVDRRLAYLGRIHRHGQSLRAIGFTRQRDVVPSFNIMLFDPDCTLDDVSDNMDFLADHPDLPWNFSRTEIYSGTALLKRLESEGRLTGDYRSYGYVMRDAAAEVMFRILRVAFHNRAFRFDSLLNRLISLSFTRQVHSALGEAGRTDFLKQEVRSLIVAVRKDTVDEVRRVLAFAATADPTDKNGIRSFAARTALEMNRRDLGFHERVQYLFARLNAKRLPCG